MRAKAYKTKSIIVFLLMLFSFQARSNSIVTINIDSSPVNLIPPLLTDTYANWIMLHIGDRLVDEHGFGSFVSNLAETWDSDFESLNNYYTNDGSDYYSQFSLESYISIMSSINSFKINFQTALSTSYNRKLILVGISSDSFTPLEDVESLSISLNNSNYKNKFLKFKSDFGHEAWILEGEKLYEILHPYLYSDILWDS